MKVHCSHTCQKEAARNCGFAGLFLVIKGDKMQKRGNTELYIFLAFAIVAGVGLAYTMLPGTQETGLWGEGLDCQSRCFGTEPGQPRVGQESLGGAQLRQCLSDCQAGIPYQQSTVQECYTCNGGGVLQKMTAEDQNEALIMCERAAGSEATITNVEQGPCPY